MELRDGHEQKTMESVEADAIESVTELLWQRRLDLLPQNQKTAVVLRHVADLSYAEIAAAQDRPEGSVKSDVHRGLERLRVIVEQEEES